MTDGRENASVSDRSYEIVGRRSGNSLISPMMVVFGFDMNLILLTKIARQNSFVHDSIANGELRIIIVIIFHFLEC